LARAQRKLAVILAADVVGYSRLIRPTLEHIPFGCNQPNGMCPLQLQSPARAFPSWWNRFAVSP
jgi:hypothetical protein